MRSASIALALLLLVTCLNGCKTKSAPPPRPAPGVHTAEDLPIELAYPQSDDQGHYVSLADSGSVVVSGIVTSPEPPTRILVNGIPSRPYRVERITPYSIASTYPTYRFHVPVVLAPTDQVVVQVIEPYPSREVIFLPDRVAVVNRWHTLYTAAPADPWLATRLGSAYYAEDAYTDSITYLSRALNDKQDAPWTLYNLGMSYLALKRADQALDYFGRGVALYPALPDYYYGRGMTYYVSGRRDAAVRELVHASDLGPDWAEPLLALGLTYYLDKRLSDSARYYDRAITVWPYWAAPRYGLAYVYLDQGRDHDAIRILSDAERLGPWRSQHHLALAEKLYARGNYNAAWRQLQIAGKLGGYAPAPFLVKLRGKAKDPGKLAEVPWKQAMGPGRKDFVKLGGATAGGKLLPRERGKADHGAGKFAAPDKGLKHGPGAGGKPGKAAGKFEGGKVHGKGVTTVHGGKDRGPRAGAGKHQGGKGAAKAAPGKGAGKVHGSSGVGKSGAGKAGAKAHGGKSGAKAHGGGGGNGGSAKGHGKGAGGNSADGGGKGHGKH